jgi:superfamily II DNA or RNA helicase
VEVATQKHRGIFHCPTGSGKTEVMVAASMIWPCRWVAFVHRKSLLKEIAERYESRTGEEAGIVGDGVWKVRDFTVASFQTAYQGLCARDPRVMKFLASRQGVHVDECHTVPADTFWQVLMACPNAYFRYGYSATPFARGDRKGLLVVAATGPTLYRIETKVLVESGATAKAKVTMVPVKHPPMPGTYAEVREHLMLRAPARLRATLGAVKKAKWPALVFVREIPHGELLQRVFTKAGVACEFLDGSDPLHRREAAVKRLEQADIDVLVTTSIFQEGVNIPCLRTVVHAAGGKSHIVTLQNAGRGTRRRDRDGSVVKDEVEVFDIADRGCGCKVKPLTGGPARYAHKSCEWLEKHTRSRIRAYLGEGYELVEAPISAP